MRLNNTVIEFKKVKESPKGYIEYFYLTKNEKGDTVGSCVLRIEAKTGSLFTLGNIGYETDEPYRRLGHAKNAATMLLSEARGLGLSRAVICCNAANLGSVRICRSLGAKELGEIKKNGQTVLRFEKNLEGIEN